ncbi:SET domain-containing protein 5 [Psilocybe cubensis]|uniref:SET domain-containing protein n=2 Tax=Psilocybe cubensis TaxID=181762 RepID=A0A8H7XSF4_PSICU|nr:SET domain-containing protein 5 [Psilocybe cubensis]KAH9477849.1 SET domain-containing protein 5 [Psilocybe cubensis]
MAQSVDTETYILDGRTYTLHTITLPASECSEEATISCLLEPALISLLPNPVPPAHKPITNPNFCVLQTEHKGAGLFAARDIAAGELIMVEHPALILPTGRFPAAVYDELARRLPAKRRAELLAMANARSEEECPSPVEGIVRTNALMLELDPKGTISQEKREIYGGVYPTVNRANHSCGPNATVKWDLSTLTETLYALRPIVAGEEIQKTYINPIFSREKRMSILLNNYRFSCDCPWCNIRSRAQPCANVDLPLTEEEQALVNASDKDRALLGTWIFTHPGYNKWSTDLSRKDDVIINSHMEALALLDKEGMHGLQNLFIEEIAMCYAMLGDLDAFKMWGERVVQLSRIEDPSVARKFEEWLVEPTKLMKKWAWRKRQREQAPGKRKLKTGHAVPVDVVDGFDSFFNDTD